MVQKMSLVPAPKLTEVPGPAELSNTLSRTSVVLPERYPHPVSQFGPAWSAMQYRNGVFSGNALANDWNPVGAVPDKVKLPVPVLLLVSFTRSRKTGMA